MSNFIYSLNATMPVFLVIVLGWILKKLHIIDDGFTVSADKLMFRVALPVLLFLDIATTDIKEDFNWRFVLFCFISTIVFIIVIWILSELFIKDKAMLGSFVQGSFRGSAAVLGIAFAQNIYGNSGMVPMMIVASVPLFNIMSVIVLTRSDVDAHSSAIDNIKRTVKGIITNPIIIGIVLGVPFAIFQVKFPTIIDKSLHSIASMSTPVALISMGAGFSVSMAKQKAKPTMIASAIKLFVLPAVLLPIAIIMGFKGEDLIAILILAGAPSTPSGYIMAKNMKNDYVLSSGIIVMTTLFSSISITLCIYILKTLNYI